MISYDIEIIDKNKKLKHYYYLQLKEILSNIIIKIKIVIDKEEFIFYTDLHYIEYRCGGETLAVFESSYQDLSQFSFSRLDSKLRTLNFENWKEYHDIDFSYKAKSEFVKHINKNYRKFTNVKFLINTVR